LYFGKKFDGCRQDVSFQYGNTTGKTCVYYSNEHIQQENSNIPCFFQIINLTTRKNVINLLAGLLVQMNKFMCER